MCVQERAREELSRKYSSKHLKGDAILTALYSISDNNSFLLFNRDPIDRVIDYLQVRGEGFGDAGLLIDLLKFVRNVCDGIQRRSRIRMMLCDPDT